MADSLPPWQGRPRSPSSSSINKLQQQDGAMIVAAYRKLAELEGCAPTAKTPDDKILEIYYKTLSTFHKVAQQRGEHLSAGNVNVIVLKFLTCYEMLGEEFTDSHFAYEAAKYLREGLREDYRRDLDFLAIMNAEPKIRTTGANHPSPTKTEGTGAACVEQPAAPRFTVPLPSQKQVAEAHTARKKARHRWLWSGIAVVTLCVIGIGMPWGFEQGSQAEKKASSLNSPQRSGQEREESLRKPSSEDFHAIKVLADMAYENGDYSEAFQNYYKLAERGDAEAQSKLGALYGHGQGVAKNDAEAVKWHRRAAEQGLAEAQFRLGAMYDNGQGVDQNDAEAMKWYRQAAEQGNALAQFNLGVMYEHGQGVDKSDAEAVKWWCRAAEQGEKWAQFKLGNMYASGRGVAQSDEDAVKWYRQAAEQGLAFAQFNLGVMYESGRGVGKSEAEAVKWYRQASDRDHEDAQYSLGMLYEQGRITDKSIPPGSYTEHQDDQAHPDYNKAVSLYEQAARKSHRLSMERLAWMYASGKGVTLDWERALDFFHKATENDPPDKKKEVLDVFLDKFLENESESSATIHEWLTRLAATGDPVFAAALEEHEKRSPQRQFDTAVELYEQKSYTESFQIFHELAKQGNASAQRNLGVMYEFGRGVEKSETEAVRWYRQAAEQGLARAQYNLGVMYEFGQGVRKNETEAVRWYRQAAGQGLAQAQCNLGVMYAYGRGVKKSEAEAVQWYRQAARQGLERAQYNLGVMYQFGRGVKKSEAEAVRWYRQAAEQGNTWAQLNLGAMYANGEGIPVNDVLSYKWTALAAATGESKAKQTLNILARRMTGQQIAEGQRLAAAFAPKHHEDQPDGSPEAPRSILEMEGLASPRQSRRESQPEHNVSTGTAFFIDNTGHLLTAHHVISGASRIRIRLADGELISARLVRADADNDVAILKTDHQPAYWLECSPHSQAARGQAVFTIGFPNAGIQGVAPKYNDGKISALSGIQDDPRHLQTSIPATNGNSGGPLLNAEGRVIGLIVKKLNDLEMLKRSGNTGQGVSYALKASYLTGLLRGTASTSSPTSPTSQIAPAVIELARHSVALVVAE